MGKYIMKTNTMEAEIRKICIEMQKQKQKLGYTHDEIADLSGVSKATVSKYLNGMGQRIDIINRLRKALKVKIKL